ncbi:MAG: hypothetical protein LUE93_08575 [Bacteroides sp.]|nr:hypothetical protein [Bacteroides sp.]
MPDGSPFWAGNFVRFYYVDEQGNNLINPDDLTTLSISSEKLLDTPPAPPADLVNISRYNNRINSVVYSEYEGLYEFFTYAYGDSRFSEFTFYVYFEGVPVEMEIKHRYQSDKYEDMVANEPKYLSDIVWWKANGVTIYSRENPSYHRKVMVQKGADGNLTISVKE